MSEEKPSADSDLAPAHTATESPEAVSVPRQTPVPAAETDGTAETDGADSEPSAPIEPVVVAEPAVVEPVAFDPPAPIEPAVVEPVAFDPPAPIEPAVVAPVAFDPPAPIEPAVVAEPAPPLPIRERVMPSPPQVAPVAPAAPVAPPSPVAPPATAPVPAVEAPPAAPATAETPAPPAKKKRGWLVGAVFGLIVVIILAAIGVLVYQRFFADPTRYAVAGNCLADLPTVEVGEDREVTRARVVDCGDPTATHVVEARINDKTEAEAKDQEVCKAFPASTFIYRAIPPGGTGYVLCLKKAGQ